MTFGIEGFCAIHGVTSGENLVLNGTMTSPGFYLIYFFSCSNKLLTFEVFFFIQKKSNFFFHHFTFNLFMKLSALLLFIESNE